MAGPYQRLSNGQSADSGAQAITTVVNAVEAGLEDAEADITALEASVAGKAATSHTHTGTYDPAGSAATAQAAAVQRANHTGTQLAATISDFNTAVRTNRLDQMAAPTASVGMGSQRITGLGTPTASTDAVTKAYADSLPTGGGSSFSNNFIHVDDYGAVADGACNYLGAVTSGSTTFSALGIANYPDRPFRSSDVGKTIRIGTLNFVAAVHTTTITAVASDGGSCTLAAAPSFSSAYAVGEWGGTDNAAAIQDALDDADGRTVLLGPGVYRIDSSLTLREGAKILGAGAGGQSMGTKSALTSIQGPSKSMICLKAGVDDNVFITDPTKTANGVTLENFMARGSVVSTASAAVIGSFHASGAYATNWYLRNLLIDGGSNSLYGSWLSQAWLENVVGFFSKGIPLYLSESPDNWIVNSGFGADLSGTYAAAELASGSDNCYVYGTAFQFSKYGLVIGSNGNTVSHNRMTDNAEVGIAVNGSYNNVVGNNVTTIIGISTGYTAGIKTGVYVSGSYNTLSGNGTVDRNGRMLIGHKIDGSGDYNKVVTGATTAATAVSDTSSGTHNTVA